MMPGVRDQGDEGTYHGVRYRPEWMQREGEKASGKKRKTGQNQSKALGLRKSTFDGRLFITGAVCIPRGKQ